MMKLTECLDWFSCSLKSLLPEAASRWVAGPHGSIVVRANNDVEVHELSKLRPFEVIVDESAILRRSFTLPAEASRDFRSATELQIETTTPFRVQDVLLGEEVMPTGSDASQKRIDVVIFPRDLFDRALEVAGVSLRQVRAIRTLESPHRNFVVPGRSLRFPPIASCAAAVFLVSAVLWANISALSSAREVVSELAEHVDEIRPRVRELTQEADRRTQALADPNNLKKLPGNISSVTAALVALNHALPHNADVLRIDVRNDGMWINLRSTDVMKVVRELQGGMPTWAVVAEGGITVDPATRSEIAIAVVREIR